MCIRFIIVIFTLFFLTINNANAQTSCSKIVSNNKTDIVVFINGINNSSEEACKSLIELRRVVGTNANIFDYVLYYNPKNLFYDNKELMLQASISNRALDIAQNDRTVLIQGENNRYQYILGKLYRDKIILNQYTGDVERQVHISVENLYAYLKAKVKSRKRVIVVAHSQGNYLIEAAIAIMKFKGETDIVSHIKVIGVAPTATSSPNQTYVSHYDDRAVNAHRILTNKFRYFSVLASNQNACIADSTGKSCDVVKRLSDNDWTAHGFVSAYLNPELLGENGVSMPEIIRQLIIKHQASLTKLPVYTDTYRAKNNSSPSEKKLLTNSDGSYRTKSAARWMSGMFGVALEANQRGNQVASYEWNFGDGRTSSSSSPSAVHNYHADGTYIIHLRTVFKDGTSVDCRKTFIFDDDFKTDNTTTLSAGCE